MRAFRLLALTALLGIAGCASGESWRKPGYDFEAVGDVAVVDVEGAVYGETARNQVGDYLAMELLRCGFGVVERRQVQSVLREQDFEASDLTSSVGIAKAGRILNVQGIVLANVANFGDRMSMTVKMLGVETAEILWIGSGSANTGRALGVLGGAALGGAAGVAMGGSTGGSIAAGIGGAFVGGAIGNELTPQEMVVAQKMIKATCKDLPRRGFAAGR
jgi:hypothetical protein